jgi:SAM-dependent methyltransferase
MSAVLSQSLPASDLDAVKARQQLAWSTGNYAVVGTTLQIVGEALCEALDLRAGTRVLDVAAGNGNATLAAARRWCDVVSTDYVGSLLEAGRARALAEGHQIQFQVADAEALPFADASFDVVLSIFGVMFTPNQERCKRARPRLQAGRSHRPGKLDARQLHRPGLQDHRQVRAARTRRQVAGPVGNAAETAGAVRRQLPDD